MCQDLYLFIYLFIWENQKKSSAHLFSLITEHQKKLKGEKPPKIEFNEKYSGKAAIIDVSKVKFTADKTNLKDIRTKYNRGVGTINKIQSILETMRCNVFW